jgi:hypothetical protein
VEQSQQQVQQVAPVYASPAAPPREATAAIRRRAWTEPRVSMWWIMSLGVLLLMLYLVVTHALAWWSERQLMTHGVAVQAVITRARNDLNDITVPNKNMQSDSECTLEFTLDGKSYKVIGQLVEHMETVPTITTGPEHPVTLRVDPENPEERWTDRTTTPPFFSRRLIGLAIALPVMALLILVAVLKRRGVLNVWRNGPASAALVVDTRQTPIAPRSQAVRCTSADSGDKRVFTVYLPAGTAKAVAGDTVWVIRPPQRSEPAYAVAWFDRPASA